MVTQLITSYLENGSVEVSGQNSKRFPILATLVIEVRPAATRRCPPG